MKTLDQLLIVTTLKRMLAVLALLSALPAFADPVITGNVEARLVAERRQVAPGTAVDLALVLDNRPHWHTYWRNPGDSGEPPRIRWQLPRGVEAGPIDTDNAVIFAAVRCYLWLSVISSAPGKQGHVDAAEADELSASRDAVPTAVLLDPDGSIGHTYGARTTPHLFVIDERGTLVYMGGIDDRPTSDPADIAAAENYLRLAMTDRAAGRPVQQAVTRPYGYSIKY